MSFHKNRAECGYKLPPKMTCFKCGQELHPASPFVLYTGDKAYVYSGEAPLKITEVDDVFLFMHTTCAFVIGQHLNADTWPNRETFKVF